MQKLLVAKNNSLLTAEAACCKKTLVTRCKIRPLLVSEITCCKTLLVIRSKIRTLLVAEVALCKKSLITRCKIWLILVEEVAHCKKSLVTFCKIRFVTRSRSCSLRKIIRYSLQTLLAARFRSGVTFYNFVKKWLQHRKFFVNFCENLRTPFCRTSANDCFWKWYKNLKNFLQFLFNVN